MTPKAKEHHKKTILVVDDNAELILFLSRLLEGESYHVLHAESGALGLKKSDEFKGDIHLLLTDFQMPKMSGVDLAIKMTVTRPLLQVLMMSGFTDGMLILNEGWHFLPKPFISSQLLTLISGLIDKPGKSRFSSPTDIG